MARPPRIVNSVLIRCWGPMQEKHQWSLSLGCWPLERLGKGVPSSCPGTENMKLIDKTGAEFPVIKDGNFCRSVLLNGKKLSWLDRQEDLARIGVWATRL